jgi:kynurenine/2-aminoadipate aminotransferase
MISLGGGAPNPLTFPVASIDLKLKDGSVITIDEQATAVALQYTTSTGLPSLSKHLNGLCETVHGDTASKHIVTNGSQDGLAKTFEMLLTPGVDSLIVESPTYSGSLSFLEPQGIDLVGVSTDGDGLIPSSLESLLLNWSKTHPNKAKPRVLYTIPTGSNPSGGTLTVARKEEVYRIASEHGVIILEDDPYYYMNFDTLDGERDKSFLSIDNSQPESSPRRVLRFDSFSKLISAGVRVGWCTGPAYLIERLEMHTQATLLHPSGLSQALVSSLFDNWGGTQGFLKHVDDVSRFYKNRRDFAVAAARQELGDLVEFDVPKAGMFLWLKLHGVADTNELIKRKAVDRKVLLVPGTSFIPNGAQSNMVRVSYSTATEEQITTAFSRLRELLQEELASEGSSSSTKL